MNFLEHHAEKSTVATTEERLKLFRKVVEPTLQRELKHKGAVSPDGSYEAELVGYIEIAGRPE
jgi:hypothetical protein